MCASVDRVDAGTLNAQRRVLRLLVVVVNVAVHAVAACIVALPFVQADDQPANELPLAGVALSVMVEPTGKAPVHAAPHEMPAGVLETVPVPLPDFAMESGTVLLVVLLPPSRPYQSVGVL